MRIELEIPFPPSSNHIWRGAGRTVYATREYKDFKDRVATIWRSVVPSDWNASCEYAVTIELYQGSRRRYDVDNRIKPTLDALTSAGAWIDDSQVQSVTAVKKSDGDTRRRAIVEIKRTRYD